MIRCSLCLLLLLLGVVPASAQPDPPDRLPNIIVILADDMGWGDMTYTGADIDMPNLDRLTAEGMRLMRFYAAAPQCSPTRAALLTGRYPHSVGVPELASPQVRGAVPILALDHAALTLPEALEPLGYTSLMVGKWHLGHYRPNWPRTHGFDAFWGSLLGTPGFYDVRETYHNETAIDVHGYFTDRITDQALAYIHQYQTHPFFLYVAYNAPHYPLEAPMDLVRKYRRRYREERPGLFALYAAMIEQMDANIGRLLAALDDLGLADDTIVIFTSDNGPSAEINSYGLPGAEISNGPLREHKFSTHEGGLRVPFLARWPGRIPAGTERNAVATTMDLMPTLLEAAGASLPEGYTLDGTSILPVLAGQPFERSGTLHWENQSNMAVWQGDWKLVHQFWKPGPSLYHLANDPGETNDVAAQHPDRVQQLQAAHAAWKTSHYPDPVPRSRQLSRYRFPGAAAED